MSQSKMNSEIEKKFVLKHCFENVMDMKIGESMDGQIERHFNVPWKLRFSREPLNLKIFLDCMAPTDNGDWSIETQIEGKVIGKMNLLRKGLSAKIVFSRESTFFHYKSVSRTDLPLLLNDGNFDFELTVIIEKATGLELNVPRARIFDDKAARETSDVTLIVGDQKFHMSKNFLAIHSSYFKALFFGNPVKFGKSIIELKEIDSSDFQRFLDFLYLESSIEDCSVLKILHLADFFDSKTVIRRCQEFLMTKSSFPLHRKFEAAVKYNLEELKTKCISEMNSASDLSQIVPENSDDLDSKVWKELFVKSLSMIPK